MKMSTHYKYLIIGGGIAGTSAAETIRQNDKTGSLGIVSAEPYPLYSRVMLSKLEFYTGKNISESIFLKKPEWYSSNKIDFLGGKTAIKLDVSKKRIVLKGGIILKYEKLLLAVGTHPRPLPDIKAADAKNILYLHTLDQAKKINQQLTSSETIMVVGGGFISIELCDLLITLGKKVISVNVSPLYWRSSFDETSSRFIKDALIKNGVQVFTESTVKELTDKKVTLLNVKTAVETIIPCSLIIASIGTYRILNWIEEAGLKINEGILTNEYMETNIPDVWAAGDCAEYFDIILKKSIALENWTNARINGGVAGLGMVGRRIPYRKTTFYVTQRLGLSIGFVGDFSPIGKSRITITRGSFESGAYTQLRIDNDKLVGATLINMSSELGALVTLIESEITVTGQLKELSDPKFNLKTLKK